MAWWARCIAHSCWCDMNWKAILAGAKDAYNKIYFHKKRIVDLPVRLNEMFVSFMNCHELKTHCERVLNDNRDNTRTLGPCLFKCTSCHGCTLLCPCPDLQIDSSRPCFIVYFAPIGTIIEQINIMPYWRTLETSNLLQMINSLGKLLTVVIN